MIKYVVVKFRFDMGALSAELRRLQSSDRKVLAGVIGVSPSTMENWASDVYHNANFPYPNMSNFLAVCNALDLDPRDFFVLE